MRTFIFSYIISIIPLIFAFYPTFQVEPFEAITRICFYLAFPLAIAVSLVIISVKHFLGFDDVHSLAHSSIYKAAEGPSINSGRKAS